MNFWKRKWKSYGIEADTQVWHRRQVADVSVYHTEEGADGGLICGDGIKIAHSKLRLIFNSIAFVFHRARLWF